MVYVTDAKGHLTHLGRHWRQLTGQTLAEARNFGWVSALHPEDRDPVRRWCEVESTKSRSRFQAYEQYGVN